MPTWNNSRKKVYISTSDKRMARAVLEDGTGYIEGVILPLNFRFYSS